MRVQVKQIIRIVSWNQMLLNHFCVVSELYVNRANYCFKLINHILLLSKFWEVKVENKFRKQTKYGNGA